MYNHCLQFYQNNGAKMFKDNYSKCNYILCFIIAEKTEQQIKLPGKKDSLYIYIFLHFTHIFQPPIGLLMPVRERAEVDAYERKRQ